MNKKEKKELIEIFQKLVGLVLNQDEQGGCVWCGGSGKEGSYGYCDESYDCHQKDCAWVEGDRYLKQLKSS